MLYHILHKPAHHWIRSRIERHQETNSQSQRLLIKSKPPSKYQSLVSNQRCQMDHHCIFRPLQAFSWLVAMIFEMCSCPLINRFSRTHSFQEQSSSSRVHRHHGAAIKQARRSYFLASIEDVGMRNTLHRREDHGILIIARFLDLGQIWRWQSWGAARNFLHHTKTAATVPGFCLQRFAFLARKLLKIVVWDLLSRIDT